MVLLITKMFYDPDEYDLYITLLKFLAVLSSGMLAGETWFVSTITMYPGFMAVDQAEGDIFSKDLRCLWPKGLRVYRTAMVAAFAAFGVTMLEVRERYMWLYGGLVLVALLLYSKFYILPFTTTCVREFDNLNKDRRQIQETRFCRYHHMRTFMAFVSFTWLTYSLYCS